MLNCKMNIIRKNVMTALCVISAGALLCGCSDQAESRGSIHLAESMSTTEESVELITESKQEGVWRLVYQPEEAGVTKEEMEDTMEILKQRLGKYCKEAEIHQDENGNIVMELLGVVDIEEVISIIETKGVFCFIRQKDDGGNLNFAEEAGKITLNKDIETLQRDGSITTTGRDVSVSKVDINSDYQGNESFVVSLEMTEEGTQKFKDMTEEACQNDCAPIAIYYEGEILSAPRVQQPILDGHVVITGLSEYEEAERIASCIQFGELKMNLKMLDKKYFEIESMEQKD